jgi:xylono-1,5-lactonase
MRPPVFETVAEGMGFVEAPVYDQALGLLVADETVGGVWRLGDGAPQVVVPHRRGISGVVVHRNGSIIVSGRNVAAKVPGDVDSSTTVLVGQDRRRLAFGDMTVDGFGRVLVGAFGYRPHGPVVPDSPPPGQLLCIERDGTIRVVDDDVLLPNGIGLSPDARRIYHVDSVRNHVLVHDVDDGGAIGPAELFATIEHGTGDGLAVAADGSVWVAVLGGGGVLVLEADGSRRAQVQVGGTVTSVCFAGPDLDQLVVTVVDDEGAVGRVLRARGVGPGVVVPRATITLPPPPE